MIKNSRDEFTFVSDLFWDNENIAKIETDTTSKSPRNNSMYTYLYKIQLVCTCAAGVDRTVVSKIERAVTNPSIEILLKLSNQLDVDLNDLFAN